MNLRYRCDVCGVELKLTAAPDEDPPPPRHCLEEMLLVAPRHRVSRPAGRCPQRVHKPVENSHRCDYGHVIPVTRVDNRGIGAQRHLVAVYRPPSRQARPTIIGMLESSQIR